MANNVGSDFEWVNARAACSPQKVFEQLHMQVARDVELRNAMRSQNDRYKFRVDSEMGMFAVSVEPFPFTHVPHQIIRFHLDGQTIVARYGDDADIFIATLTLNDEGECRLRIKDKNYDLWQVRHMALERLFFGIYRAA
jgi:hypothetical protein